MRGASLLQDEKYCYVTYKRTGMKVSGTLELHHVYAGKNRKKSDELGCWVWLKPVYHRTSNYAVHGRDGATLDMELKRDCQTAYEAKIGTRADFIKEFGRNYL